MRQLIVVGMFAAVAGLVQAGGAGAMKCKADGLHLCCGSCEKTVSTVLGKVEGVSSIKVDRNAADKVTFEAKSEKTAEDAMAALVKAGFFPEVTVGGKKLVPAKQTVTATGDELTVKGVHLCCGACVTAVKGLFKESTITVSGSGAQRDMTISGKMLNGQTVLDTMRKAGFTGTVEAKK
jgi:periplasmic mercuric ion binding protein